MDIDKKIIYTEHNKYHIFTDEQRSAIFEFIEFLDSHYDVVDSIGGHVLGKKIFHNMLKIDEVKLELERRDMIEKFRKL